jgi:SAM-dependent methyltransferase
VTPAIIDWASKVVYPKLEELTHALGRGLRVGELGSQDVNGTLRTPLGPVAGSWLGVDKQAARGVDVVGGVEELIARRPRLLSKKWETGFDFDLGFDAVVCTEAIEHDPFFWETMEGLYRCVRPGGYLVASSPSYGFPYHGYPKDYYRFSPDAWREVLLVGYEVIDLREVGGPGDRITVALGKRNHPSHRVGQLKEIG